jgi:hypothetical protein
MVKERRRRKMAERKKTVLGGELVDEVGMMGGVVGFTLISQSSRLGS